MKTSTTEQYQQKDYLVTYFKRISLAVLACLIFVTSHQFLIQTYDTAILLLALCVYVPLHYLFFRRRNPQLGLNVLIAILAVSACVLMWRNEGLTDESVFLFPCILVFAVLLANRFLTLALFCFFAVNIMAVGAGNQWQYIHHESVTSNINTAIILVVVLGLFTFAIHLVSKEVNKILNALAEENRKVIESKREILHLHHHDPLTGLPNRELAKLEADKLLKHNIEQELDTALLFIDIDNFKSINDSLGHSAGDSYLIKIAYRIKRVVGEKGSVFRFAGDEFLVLLSGVQEHTEINSIAAELLNTTKQAVIIDGYPIRNSISIGIAVSPQDGETFQSLCQKADIAMYSGKHRGRGTFQYFNNESELDQKRQRQLGNDIHECVAANELEVVFQCERVLETGEMFGAEALLRWKHSDLGIISPTEFIPVAERNGTIIDIGQWVLEQSIKTCSSWHKSGANHLSISVNVSPIQLLRPDFSHLIASLLQTYQLEGKWLILELTELILVESKQDFLGAIKQIRNLDVQIAIDDFGTGYSNLGYLQRIDATILKIDKRFVQGMLNSKNDRAIVETIINMAKIFKLKCVAEGVENKTLAMELQKMGADIGQGFYWSKPTQLNEFNARRLQNT